MIYNVEIMRAEKLNSKQRQRLKNSLKTVIGLMFLGFLYLSFFYHFGFGIPCIIKKLTGLKCPGCGMSHALVSVVRGDIGSAYAYNALSVTLLPVLGVYLVFRTISYVKDGDEDFKWYDIVFLLACLAVCVGFFIYRNL